jgi:predicted component of type VI protein secretion system
MVSRLHCALTMRDNEVRIRDLGSTNGTIVDGERLTEEFVLTDGDIFQVGPLAFQVVIRHGSATAQAPVAPAVTPVAPAPPQGVGTDVPKADDVVQWLISDSKSEIPSSGSGVYAGDTMFTAGARDKGEAADSESTSSLPDGTQPVAKPVAQHDRAGTKVAEKKTKVVEATGAAAHAAEDLIHRFLERRQK